MTNISLCLQVSHLEASLAWEEQVVPQERPRPTQEEVAVPPPPPPTKEREVSTHLFGIPCCLFLPHWTVWSESQFYLTL